MTAPPPRATGERHGRGCLWMTAHGAVGLVLSAGLAYGAVNVIGHTWRVCGDLEPPYGFALLFWHLPLTALVILVAWLAAGFMTRRRSLATSIVVPLAVAILSAWASIAASVPMNDPAFYADGDAPVSRDCGPGGVPTWWPRWIPI